MKQLICMSALLLGVIWVEVSTCPSVAAQDGVTEQPKASPPTRQTSATDGDAPQTNAPPNPAAAPTDDAPTKPTSADPEAVKVMKAVQPKLLAFQKQHPDLYGVKVVADSDPATELQVRITLIVDKDQPKYSKDEIEKLIEEDAAKGLYEIEVKTHPVKELLTQLKQRLSDDVDLKNCRIERLAYDVDDAGAVAVVMRGLIIDAGQRQKLTEACNMVIDTVYGKSEPGVPTAKSSDLRLLEPPDASAVEAAAKLQKDLIDSIRTNPRSRVIHGAAVSAYREPATEENRFTVAVVIDRNLKEASLDDVKSRAAKILPENSYSITEQPHPVLEVRERLRKEVAENSELEGCCVDDVYYEADDLGFAVQLRGAFLKVAQKGELIALCNRILEDAYGADKAPPAKSREEDLVFLQLDEKLRATVDDLAQQYQVIIRREAHLYGALLTSYVDACAKMTRFKILVIVDRDAQDISLAEFDALATKKLPAGSFDKAVAVRHPVADFLKKLRTAVEKMPDLAGCRVDDVHIIDDGDGLSLSLVGELQRSDQRAAITQLCNGILEESYRDTELAVPVTRSSEMRIPRIKPELFIAKLKIRLAGKTGFTGCLVAAAEYSDEGKGDELILSGSIAHSGQRALVIREANAVLSETYGNEVPIVPIARGFEVVAIPTDELVAELQRRIEVERTDDLGGCQVKEIKYLGESDQEAATLRGRIASPNQRELLTNLANDIIELKYGSDWPRASATQLQLIPSSPSVAVDFFNDGIMYFTKRNFAAAENAFARAILENPRRIEYRYWHVASQIGNNKIDQAYERLHPMTHSRRKGENIYDSRYAGVLSSLERVQGPIRRTLRQLEVRAFIAGAPSFAQRPQR